MTPVKVQPVPAVTLVVSAAAPLMAPETLMVLAMVLRTTDPEAGKVFCLSTGPSKEAVMRIHKRAGHPTAEIYELPIEVF